jgi:ferredoxin
MNKADVYHFSGTGNSLVLAKLVAERLGGGLIPIASVIDREKIEPVADVVGIVFPVYYADTPNIVRRFAEKLENTEGKYIFAISNCGGGAGDSLKTLDRILRSHGKTLSAGFGVHMPQNAFRKLWEMKSLAYRLAPKRIDFIARSIEARRKGLFYSNVPLQMMRTLFQGWLRRMAALYLEKASNTPAPSGLTVEQLMPLADRLLSVDENCTECGACARVCPVHNIEIVDAKPGWQNRCRNCLACFKWRPADAIHGALTNTGYRYHHPDVTARDIAGQSEPQT